MGYFTLASGAHTTLRLSGFPPLSGVPFSLTVYTSYATNTVKGDLYLGGLAGRNTGSIKASYAAVAVTGSASSEAYEELTEAYRRERAAHRRTKRMARTLGVVAVTLFALLAVGILVTWRLFT